MLLLLNVVSLRVSFGDLWSCCMRMRLIDWKGTKAMVERVGCLRSIGFLKYVAMIGEWLLWVLETESINRLILLGYKSRWCLRAKHWTYWFCIYIYIWCELTYIYKYTHIYIHIYTHSFTYMHVMWIYCWFSETLVSLFLWKFVKYSI